MDNMEQVDLAIIGAGIHGLTVAKTYQDVHPNASILILDKRATVGGTWAREALYPGLKTNNHFGSFEFSDLRMDSSGFGENAHIPGPLVHNYLYTWAEKHDLLRLIRLGCSVQTAEDRNENGWILTVMSEVDPTQLPATVHAAKLVISTGLTSQPFLPKFRGGDDFEAPIYHSSDFAKECKNLGSFRKVAILGGNKFSWDIAQEYAASGVQVEWIIRSSGHGPCWMAKNKVLNYFIPEFFLKTRLITWFSPCIWGDADGYGRIRRFLHRTWLGRKIVKGFFAMMQAATISENGYHKHPETAKLVPWSPMFYTGLNLLNYNIDFFQLVRSGKVKVHIADIDHLSKHTVHLSNGDAIGTEVLVCGTGWKDAPPINFVTKRDMGLPCLNPVTSSTAIRMEEIADKEILERFPGLAEQPPQLTNLKTIDGVDVSRRQPYRLYRFMVPPAYMESRTLAFAGVLRSPSTSLIAQTQALWITAFLNNEISSLAASGPKNINRVTYETVLHTQFSKWRYSRGFGDRYPELWFDSLPYLDMLLNDLGMRIHRKGSWWREIFNGYSPRDYVGVVGEWKDSREKNINGKV